MRLFPLILLFVCCCSCDGNTAARKAARGQNFVSDPDHLYFKNTRARHYRAEEVTNRATVFRHDDLFSSESHLLPVLIDNWLQDRAIIRFETRPETTGWELEVAAKDLPRKRFPLSVPPTNQELDRLATILLGNDELYLRSGSDSTIVAFPAARGRAAARSVLLDYLRLVGY